MKKDLNLFMTKEDIIDKLDEVFQEIVYNQSVDIGIIAKLEDTINFLENSGVQVVVVL